MKIAAIEVFVLNFSQKAVFVLAGGVVGAAVAPSPRVLVKLTMDDGVTGWGEATPTPRWTYETTETIVTDSRQLCEMAEAAGLGLSLSGLTETDLGLATGMHLAAAFDINPLQLTGPQFIETTARLWKGDGRVTLPAGPGLGVEVDEAYVRQHAQTVTLE